MTAEQWIKYCRAVSSTKYLGRYDINGHVDLHKRNLTEIPIPFGLVKDYFDFSYNKLTSLQNAPIEVNLIFWCYANQLTSLEHLPKYIGSYLICENNPFQNLNGLKDVEIKKSIIFFHKTENELDYWIKAVYNTNLDVLEYHYDKHRYYFINNIKLENYVMNSLEEIIKIKTMKNHLNV